MLVVRQKPESGRVAVPLILWLAGVPIVVIILLHLTGILH